MLKRLTDYIHTTIPVDTVRAGLRALADLEVRDARIDRLTLALEAALNLDHRRVNLASISEALGDLGHGDVLATVAERLRASEAADGVRLGLWDDWAVSVTRKRGRAEDIGRMRLRAEIAATIAGADQVQRERDQLLEAVSMQAGLGLGLEDALRYLGAEYK